jgi:hypothetical protein
MIDHDSVMTNHDEVMNTNQPTNNTIHNNTIQREPTSSSRFTKPELSEVYAYCKERKNKVNAQSFLDFYESKGWMIGKNKMKDWKAAVRTWEKNESTQQTKRLEYVPSGVPLFTPDFGGKKK